MEKEKKQLGVAFIVVLVAIVMVSAIGIIAMSDKPVVLQGQIEATEIRISGKLPGRIDTFLVREGQYVKMGDTLVVINSPEAWAKFQQVNALEDIAKFQNKKIDDGTRRQIVRSVEELWNKSKSDLQLATVTYDRIQALYKDSVVTSQRKDEVEAMYKAAVAAERAAHQQFLLVKDGAQKEDKESARSLVDAARGTVNEVQALLMDARLTAPENGQISTIYPKRGELVGAGTPIMSLVVLDDCHVVLNVREDYMPYFRMNENFMGDIPALDVKNKAFKPDEDITICTQFTIGGEQENIRRYLDADEYELLSDFEKNLEKIKDAITEKNGARAVVDDMPYVIGLGMDCALNLHEEYKAILDMYEKEQVTFPIRAFFGDLLERPRRTKAYPIALLNQNINLDQLLAINNAMKYPVSYTHLTLPTT